MVMVMKIAKRCRIRGRVQGVFYRASTQAKALSHNITGWARNRPDGSVEVLACGEQCDVEALQKWLWQGPVAAKVTAVECQAEAFQLLSGFETG